MLVVYKPSRVSSKAELFKFFNFTVYLHMKSKHAAPLRTYIVMMKYNEKE